MPEVSHTTTVGRPTAEVWEFVKDMNNWAPFVTGYQSHEQLSETDSLWTLKGDVGILSRTVELRAHVTEWDGPSRVTFTLTGINEDIEGGGTLVMEACTAAPPKEPPKLGLFARILRFLFRKVRGAPPERQLQRAGEPASQLTFTLRMDAGGATGPLVNAMLGPALAPAAEELASKIAAHLESSAARPAA